MLGEDGAEQEANDRGHHEHGKQDVEDDHHGRHLCLSLSFTGTTSMLYPARHKPVRKLYESSL
jgi:hypothetical protein